MYTHITYHDFTVIVYTICIYVSCSAAVATLLIFKPRDGGKVIYTLSSCIVSKPLMLLSAYIVYLDVYVYKYGVFCMSEEGSFFRAD